jgi:hypothetical protein
MNQKTRATFFFLVILVPLVGMGATYSYYSYLVGGGGGSGIFGTPGPCFNVTIIIDYGRDYGRGVNETYPGLNFPEGATVFDALLNVSSVGYQYTGSLVLVTAINGVSNNVGANLFWQYYVGGAFGLVASNLYHLGNDSVVKWRYQPSQF